MQLTKYTNYAPEKHPDKDQFIEHTYELFVGNAKGIADSQKKMDFVFFLEIAQASGLNPLKKDVYAIYRAGKMTVQTSIDGFRIVAGRDPNFAGSNKPQFSYDSSGKLEEATIEICKYNPGTKEREVVAVGYAHWEEFAVANNPMWKKMPRTMLAKCAEAQGLRKAYPNDLSKIYINEEMQQADAPRERVKATTRKLSMDHETKEEKPKANVDTSKDPKKETLDLIKQIGEMDTVEALMSLYKTLTEDQQAELKATFSQRRQAIEGVTEAEAPKEEEDASKDIEALFKQAKTEEELDYYHLEYRDVIGLDVKLMESYREHKEKFKEEK